MKSTNTAPIEKTMPVIVHNQINIRSADRVNWEALEWWRKQSSQTLREFIRSNPEIVMNIVSSNLKKDSI